MSETLNTGIAEAESGVSNQATGAGRLSELLLQKLAVLEQAGYPGADTVQIAQFVSPIGRLLNNVRTEDTVKVIQQQAVNDRNFYQYEDSWGGSANFPVLSNTPPPNHKWKHTRKNLWLKDQMPGYPLSEEVSNTNPGQSILLANGRVAEKIGVIHQVFGPVISEGQIRFQDPPKTAEYAEEDYFQAHGTIAVWANSQHSAYFLSEVELESGNAHLQKIIDTFQE